MKKIHLGERSYVPLSNIFKVFGTKYIKPISRSDIPIQRGRGRSTMLTLPQVEEFCNVLDKIKKNGVNPADITGEFDMKAPEIEAERKNRKSFPQTFRKLLRRLIEEHGLSDEVQVSEHDNGRRVIVSGRLTRRGRHAA